MSHSLLATAESYLGPLSRDYRIAILNYLDAQSLGQWLLIRSIVINSRSMRRATLWQNVAALDAQFSQDGCTFPSALLVARAIKAALS